MPGTKMTALEIADLIDRLQATYAAWSAALFLSNDDQVLQMLVKKGFDPDSTVRLGRQDNTYYDRIRVWDSINLIRGNSQFNLDFLNSMFMTTLCWVGNELKKNKYFDKTPELEFFRHLRNGVSHGNRFNFQGKEPRLKSEFKGFKITRDLEGQAVLFKFMSTGDLFDLFDVIKAQLRAINPQKSKCKNGDRRV